MADILALFPVKKNNDEMRKIIAIGECRLDIFFRNNAPWLSLPGATILNAAASLGKRRREISFVGEAAADHVGDMLVEFLTLNNVGTHSVDRFTDGVTPVTLIFTDDHDCERHRVSYERYSAQSLGVVWPRIDHDDIVVFGGIYALDQRVHSRLFDIIKYARERKAVIVYAPDMGHNPVINMTHVKPSILENLEMADIVVTAGSDLKTIFGEEGGSNSYNRDISFYCFNHINADFDESTLSFYNRKKTESAEIKCSSEMRGVWLAGAIAGVVDALLKHDVLKEATGDFDQEMMKNIVEQAALWGGMAIETTERLVPLNDK